MYCCCEERLTANFLKLNDSKSDGLLTGSSNNYRSMPFIEVKVRDQNMESSKSISNLGVIFDERMSMSNFVDKKCSSILHYLKAIGKARN